jgi:hypothetical protein
MMTEEFDFRLDELALGFLGVELLLAEHIENLANVLLVFSKSLGVDEDVIEKHEGELVEKRAEGLMHEMHERGGGVGQTKREDEEFEMTVASPEGCLSDIAWVNADLVVTGAKVNLGEVSSALETVEEFVDARKRVAVLDRDVVESAIVNAHAGGAVLFLDKKNRSTEGRLGWLDKAGSLEFVELRAEFGEFGGAHVIRGATGWTSARKKFDFVIDFSLGWEAGRKLFGHDVAEFGE